MRYNQFTMVRQQCIRISAWAICGLLCFGGCQQRSRVFFKNIEDGDHLRSPIRVEMGVSGMKVEPAGEVREGYGHHHILINQTHFPKGEVIPQTDSTIHYGKGQIEAEIELPVGVYTLSLQFADGVHASYGKELAASVEVFVEE